VTEGARAGGGRAAGEARTEPRAGSVALLGWTNVGKSSLLNRLVGSKLAAVAAAAQTTRHRITGVVHLGGAGQIALVDAPGLHRPQSRMNRRMVRQLRHAVAEADLALLVVDAARGIGAGDQRAARLLRTIRTPFLVALNKIDLVRPKSALLPLMRIAVEEWGAREALPVSAASGEGCAELARSLLRYLAPSAPPFPEDYLTDQPLRSLAAEWIREQLVAVTSAELPHATAVLIEHWRESSARVEIDATILVERASQRPIVIGRGGRNLKQIGQAARLEIGRLIERPVVLRLWVKVRQDWRNDERVLREIGL